MTADETHDAHETQRPRAADGTWMVVVTFNRSELLKRLLPSILEMDPLPTGVVVVDNASSDDTPEVVRDFAERLPEGTCDYVRLDENRGGSGGFAAGVRRAMDLGAQWIWMMDDDVVVMPDALALLAPYQERYGCIHGRRYDHDGSPFFWQTRFHEWLGIFLPVPGDLFTDTDVFHTNVGTFEGMLVRRDVVDAVGIPDERFFLTWDDAVYGWMCSRVTDVVYVDRYVLQKIRPQRSISLGIRHLNDSSDLSRFYVMRNRGYVAHYLRAAGAYSPIGFAVGTALTTAKELLRTVAVERHVGGVRPLLTGYREGRRIAREPWTPVGPMPAGRRRSPRT